MNKKFWFVPLRPSVLTTKTPTHSSKISLEQKMETIFLSQKWEGALKACVKVLVLSLAYQAVKAVLQPPI